MTLVSIGDQIEEGVYPFHSRFRRAVNFQQNDRLVSVVDEGVGDGPLNIVLQGLQESAFEQLLVGADRRAARGSSTRRAQRSRPTSRMNCAAPLEISEGKFVFEGRAYRFTQEDRYCSTLEAGAGLSPHFRHNLFLFGKLLQTSSHPKSLAFLLNDQRTDNFRSGFERTFAEQVRYGVSQIFFGDRLKGVRTLSGCGLGLTPSGDDFIAGLLIGLNLRGTGSRGLANQVFAAARSDNVYSDTFLDLARRGRLFGRMKNLILALGRESEDDVRKCTESLLAVGGTSGADLGTGFFLTLWNGFGAS